jgi:hypothetical protein
VRELLTGAPLLALFTEARASIRRLSTRDNYDADNERDAMASFLAGEPDPSRWAAERKPYLDNVRAKVAAGVRYERIEIVPEPLTTYLRFDAWLRQQSVPAGEDVRYLERSKANRLDLPDHDYWTFDGERLVWLYFTADDRLLGGEVITDGDVVARHEAWLDLAAAHATPWAEYLTADPSRGRPPDRPT